MAVELSRCYQFNLIFCIFLFVNINVLQANVSTNSGKKKNIVVSLIPNVPFEKENNNTFQTFCYNGSRKSLFYIWRSVNLLLEKVPEQYSVFVGENDTDVQEKIDARSYFDPTGWYFSGQKTNIKFSAFSPYCAGIESTKHYTVILDVRTIKYWKLCQSLLGIAVFLCAPSLSRNPFFHYTSGIAFGVLASLLIFIYIISRFVPKKPFSYAVIVFGYSFVLYIIQWIWQDMNALLANYADLIVVYCLMVAFLSFIVCYRLGPVQNERTFNIIQWTMQILGILIIYFSSEYREASTAFILLLLTAKAIPTRWILKSQKLWYYYFPPRVRLLTEMEYIEQGNIETKKSLEELRNYCSSPDCNSWKVVRKLNDPYRFAKFVETGSHCTDEELLQYNSEELDEMQEDSDSDSQNSRQVANCSYR